MQRSCLIDMTTTKPAGQAPRLHHQISITVPLRHWDTVSPLPDSSCSRHEAHVSVATDDHCAANVYHFDENQVMLQTLHLWMVIGAAGASSCSSSFHAC